MKGILQKYSVNPTEDREGGGEQQRTMEQVGKIDKMMGLNPTILASTFKVKRLNTPCKRLSNFKGKKSRPSSMLFTRNILL